MGQFSDIKNPPPQPHIVITRLLEDDEHHGAPDTTDEGFWPSLDPKAPGWIGDNPEKSFEVQQAEAQARMQAWEDGVFCYQGVRAKARVIIPIGGQGVCIYVLKSPGLWGIESDSGEEYLNEVYEEQAAELLAHIKQFAGAVENVTIEKE